MPNLFLSTCAVKGVSKKCIRLRFESKMVPMSAPAPAPATLNLWRALESIASQDGVSMCPPDSDAGPRHWWAGPLDVEGLVLGSWTHVSFDGQPVQGFAPGRSS